MAATIIDALLVTLGIDMRPFQKGIQDVKSELLNLTKEGKKRATEEEKTATKLDTQEKDRAKKQRSDREAEERAQKKAREKKAKEIEAQAKKAGESMLRLRNEALGMAAALLGTSVITSFVAQITRSDASVGRLSNNLGIATEELTAWKGAAEKMGGTGADIEGAFRNINKIIQDYRLTGSSSAFAPLARAGVDLAKFLSNSTTMAQRANLIADAMKRLSPQDAQTFGGMAGFGEDAITVLMQGSQALNEQVEAQHKANTTMPADVAAAKLRTAAWSRLTDSIETIGRKVTTVLTPAIEWVLDLITGNMPAAIIIVAGVAAAFTSLTLIGFGGLIGGLGGVAGGLGAAAIAGGTLLGVLGKIVAVGAIAHAALSWLDPSDKLGAWIDGNIPGASWLDNAASKVGLGRSYAEQGIGSGAPAAASSAGSESSASLFKRLEGAFGLPAGLLDAVWARESSRGKNKGPSKAGAMGDFQFMPDTAKAYGLRDPNDLAQSATAAAKMFRDLLKQYGGNLDMALAGYNWGSGNLARHGTAGFRPPETVGYINSIRNSMRSNNGGGGTSTTDVKVGHVTINTQATDANGIAIAFGDAVMQHSFASQSNSGIR